MIELGVRKRVDKSIVGDSRDDMKINIGRINKPEQILIMRQLRLDLEDNHGRGYSLNFILMSINNLIVTCRLICNSRYTSIVCTSRLNKCRTTKCKQSKGFQRKVLVSVQFLILIEIIKWSNIVRKFLSTAGSNKREMILSLRNYEAVKPKLFSMHEKLTTGRLELDLQEDY